MRKVEAAEFIYHLQNAFGHFPGMSLDTIRRLQNELPGRHVNSDLHGRGVAIQHLTKMLVRIDIFDWWEAELIREAAAFATEAHKGQKRKFTDKPYIDHPREVAAAVIKYCNEKDVPSEMAIAMASAAWLHDVVEDCGVKRMTIYDKFGDLVGDLVCGLTCASLGSNDLRETRKRMDCEAIAKAQPPVKQIKMFDIIFNCRGMLDCPDPRFRRLYAKEKHQMLSVIRDADEGLAVVADQAIKKLAESVDV